MVEQIAHNDLVVGSSPTRPTKINNVFLYRENTFFCCNDNPAFNSDSIFYSI